jgi:hypothetical protein
VQWIAFPIVLPFGTKLYYLKVLTPVFQYDVKTMKAHHRLGKLINMLGRKLANSVLLKLSVLPIQTDLKHPK